MILNYGSYAHADAECSISITRESIKGDQGQPVGIRESWQIRGRKNASDQASLNTALIALEKAYGVNGQDIYLSLNAGGSSVHRITSDETVNGVIVESLSYPNGTGAQFTTFRDYEITVSAELSNDQFGGSEGQTLNFSESIVYNGSGGPRYVVKETLGGPPVRQPLTQQTIQTVVQSGMAEAIRQYPQPSRPIRPDYMPERYQVVNTTRSGGGQTRLVTRWSYTFQF